MSNNVKIVEALETRGLHMQDLIFQSLLMIDPDFVGDVNDKLNGFTDAE